MTEPIGENMLVTGDAHVQEYSRTFDGLEIHVVLWDETVRRIRALDVGVLHDIGTWECDALVRYPSLDEAARRGYAIIDTDGIPTLTFAAGEIDLGSLGTGTRSSSPGLTWRDGTFRHSRSQRAQRRSGSSMVASACEHVVATTPTSR